MNQSADQLLALLRIRQVRILLAVVTAGGYYAVVVAGEIGRTHSIILTAVPAALSLAWFRTRPGLAMALAGGGMLSVAFLMVNGVYIQDVTQQSAVLVAIFGGALSPHRAVQRVSAALAVLTALLVAPFAYSRFADGNEGAGPGSTFTVALLALVLLAFGAGVVVRLTLERGQRLGLDLHESGRREQAAERDVLVELERNRLAREVHDVVAHSLAVVIAQADGARFAAETKPETVAPALESIGDTARRALGEVRTMLHDLRTSGEGGVVPGPDDLAGLVEGVRGLGVVVDEVVWGEPRPMDRTAGVALYRVAQEALTNAMRHGDRAAPIGFEVDWGERQVVLTVTNGMPAEAVAASERAGHGVLGMRERAADAAGDCSAGVGSSGRFRVRVALPLAADEPEAPSAPPQPNPLLALLAPARG